MKKPILCTMVLAIVSVAAAFAAVDTVTTRKLWLTYMDKVARPVVEHLAKNQLKERMEVVLAADIDNPDHRRNVAYLEAFGRTLCGIAPWLNAEGGDETELALRNEYRQLTLQAIEHAVDPDAKDYLLWEGGQPLVDASFFALGLIRAPQLWDQLSKPVQDNVVQALLKTRNTVPVYSNWILFTAMIEAFFCRYGYPYDAVRIEYAMREFSEHWYVGDGMFSDGNDFNLDYYNSFVIQPYIHEILEVIKGGRYKNFSRRFDQISKRYAELQERNIHTDGSYPVTGRSIVYRGGAFHHLADMALRKRLPSSLQPSQVRAALTAVLKRTLDPKGTFVPSGWLSIGLAGKQEGLAEFYITTGSLYLCSAIFLPLGLSEDDIFWQGKEEDWTAVKVWSGQNVKADHALGDLH